MPVPLPQTTTLVRAAGAAYVANCVLGSAVQLRLIDTQDLRWVHHALFVCTATLTVSAVAAAILRRSPSAGLLGPALVPLAIVPFAGTARHVAVALSAAPWFAAALTATVTATARS